MAKKPLKSAKAKALLRAEKARAQVKAQQSGPSQGNLLSNQDPKPSSNKKGPDGAPLYNADQSEMVSDPKHKKQKGAPPPPAAKRDKSGPSPSPLYDAAQDELTDVQHHAGKPQDKLKGASRRRGGGVIQRIRRKAARG